jgi:anthranilate synthase component 2
MIIIIDNYDSFTYNLYQEMGTIEPDLIVLRNDAVSVSAIRDMKPDGIILSPGPGRPENAGIVNCRNRGNYYMGVCLEGFCHFYGAV